MMIAGVGLRFGLNCCQGLEANDFLLGVDTPQTVRVPKLVKADRRLFYGFLRFLIDVCDKKRV